MVLTDTGLHGFKDELSEESIKRSNISTATGAQAANAPTGTATLCRLS